MLLMLDHVTPLAPIPWRYTAYIYKYDIWDLSAGRGLAWDRISFAEQTLDTDFTYAYSQWGYSYVDTSDK